MATEQSTIVVYAITGSTRRFHVPFEYLSRQFVVVTVLGVGRTVLTLGSDYRFISPNEIETTVAYGGAGGNNFIEIRRVTSATDRLVEFVDGSVLRSRDMNVSAIQTIHIAEEARNLASDTLASDDDGNLDARGRRLVNLGNAVNPKDAMTYEQVTEWSNSALNQANRSQTEANKSAASAAAALASQNAAAASQSAAKTSETNAKTSETNAKTSENAAAADRVLTETARNVTANARDTILAIELTANAANASAIAAKNAAAASQSAAKTSETNAKNSETNAKNSETNAKTSETNAAASRDRAEAAKVAIENTEITSFANAQSALASKNAAAVSETNAKDSELAALQYRNEASAFTPANHLVKSSNLADIPNKSLARENLDVLQRGSVGTNLHELVTLDCNSLVTAYPWSGQIPVILTATSPNAPPTTAAGHLEQYLADSGNAVQKWVNTHPTVGGIWWRSRRGGTWDEWARVTLSSDKRVAVMDFGTMGVGQRKVLPNPFGNDRAVFCTARAEILVGGAWHSTGFVFSQGGWGTSAHAVAEGIVVQTGSEAVSTHGADSGSTQGRIVLTPSPVRAIVHHIGGALI